MTETSPITGAGEWRSFANADVLADFVSEWLCALARASDHEFAICLSGGSTPRCLYRRLADASFALRFPWNRVHWFWGDERFVPPDDSDSNYRMVYDTLLAHVPVSSDRIHAISTQGVTPEEAAANYQSTLQRYYGADRFEVDRPIFDVTLLGVGEDGHTASLFSGSAALREDRRWVLVVDETPQTRITLTYPTLDSSRNVAFLVVGANKKAILARIHAGDTTMPAARVRPVGRLYWFIDRSAMPALSENHIRTKPLGH
jgi:6-phosphogluconolactonase